MCPGILRFTYLVIGHTSPVSYQVLGHFKLLVILAAGIFIFKEDANELRLAGMLLAFAGIVMYTTLKQGMASGWEKSSSVFKAASGAGGSSVQPFPFSFRVGKGLETKIRE